MLCAIDLGDYPHEGRNSEWVEVRIAMTTGDETASAVTSVTRFVSGLPSGHHFVVESTIEPLIAGSLQFIDRVAGELPRDPAQEALVEELFSRATSGRAIKPLTKKALAR